MRRNKYEFVEKHFLEIKILKAQNLSWREISEEMKERHRLSVSYAYLRKTWLELEAKEPPPNKKQEAIERIRIHMEMQPLTIAEREKLEKCQHLADKRERLLVAAQKRNKELEEALKSIVVELEEGRRQTGKLLYARLHRIATDNIVRGK